jgi:beta-galactosidase
MMTKKIIPIVFLLTLFACSEVEKETDFDRQITSLNGEWSFCVDSLEKGFVETNARKVNVPHTWNIEKGLEEYHGHAWYKKTFEVPEDLNGNLNRIKFNAVYHTATVWVNGKEMTRHIGSGYTPFYVDVSDVLKYGEENEITLLVDNSFSRQAIPWGRSYDWAADGGITRDVEMISTGKPTIQYAHISPQIDLENKNAKVKIDLSLLATEGIEGEVEIRVEIEKNDEEIIELEQMKQVAENISLEFEMENIELWHFDHPNVYDVEIEIEKDGNETDEYETSFGFRKLEVKGPELFLNGESVRLMAVEWMPGSSLDNGMAENKEELIENLERIKEVNCVLTRFHWQQDEAIFDWCDRNGILVQEEISVWGNMMPPWNDTILQISQNQIDEMMAEHFNHPSLVMWGIGNEYTKDGTPEFIQTMYDYCKEKDPDRLVTYVSNGLHKLFEKDATTLCDIMMWNDYTDTWIGKTNDQTPVILDEIHKAIPDKPLIISEYGLCEPQFKGGDERRVKQLVENNGYYDTRPWIVGAVFFSLNDYRTHMGEEGKGVYRQRVHGVYDIHEVPKPSKEVLKSISAPIKIQNIKQQNGELEIEILCNDKMPSYTCKGYYVTVSEIEKGEAFVQKEIPVIKPGEITSVIVKSPENDGFVNLYRPAGFHVISQKIE